MPPTLTCESCGREFTPRPELLERYPGWEPPECRDCYRDGGQGGGGPTLEQVLERYEGGPDTGVFTDGAAQPNPGPGGWGAVWVVEGEVLDAAHGHEPDTTNNRMELTAVAEGIELVPEGTAATIHSDSRLVVRTMNEWAEGWKRRGWKRSSGPVRNLDLVEPIYETLRARPELELTWIAGHAGNRWNEYADALATAWLRDEL